MKDIMRIDFTFGVANSDGKLVEGTETKVSVLYNRTVITDNEVCELLNSGMYENDDRIIITTPARADNLGSI